MKAVFFILLVVMLTSYIVICANTNGVFLRGSLDLVVIPATLYRCSMLLVWCSFSLSSLFNVCLFLI